MIPPLPQPASAHSAAGRPAVLGSPADDHPEVGTVLDLIPASRGDAFESWMDAVDGGDLLVSIPQDLARRPMVPADGERIDVIWKASGVSRCLPAVLAGIDLGEPPHWRLRPAGVVQRGQRREAVRAPIRVPIALGTGASDARATSLDLSEGGLRCVLDRQPRPAPGAHVAPQSAFRAGDVVPVSVMLPDLTITCLSEITRLHPRDDARTEMSLRFIGLAENLEDELRRRVFARLRDLRHRGLV